MMVFLWMIVLSLCSAASGLPQRDDDFKTYVLEELKLLKTKSDILEQKLTDVTEENTSLKELVNSTRTRRDINSQTQVGFSASSSVDRVHMTTDHTIKFDNVLTNIGNHYDRHTGIFTVPVTGTYLLFANILSERDNYIETEIMADADTISEIYSAGGGGFHGSGSNMVIHKLAQGRRVWVKVHEDYSTDMTAHCCWSTFSGYLLYEHQHS